MTDAAYERFQAFAQQMVDDRFGDLGGHEAIISWCLKASGKVARLALLLTLLKDVESKYVGVWAVDAAVAMMNEYFIPHMKRVYYGERKLGDAAKSLLRVLVKMGNELDGVVPQSQLRQRVRGQKQFKGDEGLVNFRESLQELENAGYIRKIPESHRAGPGRRSDGSWEVRDILLKKPVSKPTDAKAEPTVGLNLMPTIEPGIPTEPLAFEMQPNWADTELPF